MNAPSARDARDWRCSRRPPRVRLVRHIAPDGTMRVLATNLGDDEAEALRPLAQTGTGWEVRAVAAVQRPDGFRAAEQQVAPIPIRG